MKPHADSCWARQHAAAQVAYSWSCQQSLTLHSFSGRGAETHVETIKWCTEGDSLIPRGKLKPVVRMTWREDENRYEVIMSFWEKDQVETHWYLGMPDLRSSEKPAIEKKWRTRPSSSVSKIAAISFLKITLGPISKLREGFTLNLTFTFDLRYFSDPCKIEQIQSKCISIFVYVIEHPLYLWTGDFQLQDSTSSQNKNKISSSGSWRCKVLFTLLPKPLQIPCQMCSHCTLKLLPTPQIVSLWWQEALTTW